MFENLFVGNLACLVNWMFDWKTETETESETEVTEVKLKLNRKNWSQLLFKIINKLQIVHVSLWIFWSKVALYFYNTRYTFSFIPTYCDQGYTLYLYSLLDSTRR